MKSWLLSFVWLAVGVLLAGQAVTANMGDRGWAGWPSDLPRLGPSSASALAEESWRSLQGGDIAGALRTAREAMTAAPLNVTALRALGLALARSGAHDRAFAVLAFTGGRSWRDLETHRWLFDEHLARGERAAAVADADAILRRTLDPGPINWALDRLVEEAGHPATLPPLAARLGQKPAWRGPFTHRILARADRLAAAQTLFLALKSTPNPANADDIAELTTALVAHGDVEAALDSWARLGPGARTGERLLRNGAFERAADGSLFDWRLDDGLGSSAAIEPSPSGPGSALRVSYDGFSPPSLPRQLLVLAPGRYRLTGEQRIDGVAAPGQMHWRVFCGPDERVLGEAQATPVTARGEWSKFELAFEVPAACPAQWLALAADPGERREPIDVWYDNLVLAPAS